MSGSGSGGDTITWDQIGGLDADGEPYMEVILHGPDYALPLVIPIDLKMRLINVESTVEWHRKIGYDRHKRTEKRLGLLTAAVVVQFLIIILMLAMWPL